MELDWRSPGEELLEVLAWGVDALMFPRIGKVFGPGAGWDYRNCLRHRLRRLEKQHCIVREKQAGGLVYRLSSRGRLLAMGGRNPEVQWARKWDGKWRQVLFDLPVGQQALRQRLLRWLRRNGFGYLQDSVWISVDPMDEVREVLKPFRDDVERFVVMEARVCAGYGNQALLAGAWDFTEINRRYRQYLELVAHCATREVAARLPTWLRDERAAWLHAVSLDPLLPAALLPRGYMGQQAWRVRCSRMRALLRPLMKTGRCVAAR